MKASWNGRHLGGFWLAGSPPRPAERWRLARATASFMALKARRAFSSLATSAMPSEMRRLASRAASMRRCAVSLPRLARDGRNDGGLCRDPRVVGGRQGFERTPQIVGSGPRQPGQLLHLEDDVGDLLVWLDALDLGGRQVVGCGLAHDPVRIGLPVRGRVHAHRELADVPVMQVGDRLVDVLGAEAAHIGARMEARSRSARRV